ncbi:hypothetical protein J2W23_004327 [Variovorax boronicumulans]|nr:hypothetical protein [Variovorax boronicumulans]
MTASTPPMHPASHSSPAAAVASAAAPRWRSPRMASM